MSKLVCHISCMLFSGQVKHQYELWNHATNGFSYTTWLLAKFYPLLIKTQVISALEKGIIRNLGYTRFHALRSFLNCDSSLLLFCMLKKFSRRMYREVPQHGRED